MTKIHMLLVAILFTAFTVCDAGAAEPESKPNIVFIMADDLGYTDVACSVPSIHVDLYPTLLEIAGAPKPQQVLDGESLVKLFRNPAAKLQRDAIYQHFPGYLGAGTGMWRTTPVSLIQVGDWKLMEFLEDGRLELYNLADDIGEKRNLAKENPTKAKELHDRLIVWRTEVKAPMPTKNASR